MTRARVQEILKDRRGFTLIEMIVVVIILGLLAGLVAPRLFGRVGQSKQVAARAQIELLGSALDQYSLDTGSYPPSSVGLDALLRNPNAAGLERAVPQEESSPPTRGAIRTATSAVRATTASTTSGATAPMASRVATARMPTSRRGPPSEAGPLS